MAALIMVNVVVLNHSYNTSQAYADAQSTVVKTKSELKMVNERLDTVSNEKVKITDTLKETQSKSEALQKENADLKAKKQAKEEAAKIAAQAPKKQVSSVPVTGNCATWLAQAGVADTQSAMILINRESGCNPNAKNTSSGACGVAQELPCGKSGCNLGDGACQVAWMKRYVEARYGSFAAALAHSNTVGWY